VEKDIDKIIAEVRRRVPSVQVDQLKVKHSGDDDGLWWFRAPGVKQQIQIESSSGNCPFLIEADDREPISVGTVEGVVETVSKYLASLQAG
jgi:hypothetical protein